MLSNKIFILIISGIFGLAIGSFLNVVIYRLPLMLMRSWEEECCEFLKKSHTKPATLNLCTPASSCPHCQTLLRWFDNIPLFSYLLLRGKCRYCGKPISWRYPLVELLNCCLTIFVLYYFGISCQSFAVLLLTWNLLAAIFIDIDHQLLPDSLTLPFIWLGLLLNTYYVFASPTDAIIGAVSGYLSLWIVANLFKLIRKIEGMGYGDFKLFAVFGAWLGWQVLPLVILFAAFAGSIVGLTLVICKKHKFNKPLPFGPFIAVAGWLAIFWGPQALQWYLNFIRIT